MAIILNDNIRIEAPKPSEERYLRLNNTPYTSVSEANALISSSRRYQGLTILINDLEYWYKNGVSDLDLVLKSSGGNLQLITDGGNRTTNSILIRNPSDTFTVAALQSTFTGVNGGTLLLANDVNDDSATYSHNGYTFRQGVNRSFSVFPPASIGAFTFHSVRFQDKSGTLAYLDDIVGEKLYTTVNSNQTLAPGNYKLVAITNLVLVLDSSAPVGSSWTFVDTNQTIIPNTVTINDISSTFTDNTGAYQAGAFVIDSKGAALTVFKTSATSYDIIPLQAGLGNTGLYQLISEKGQPNGYAPLDSTNKIPVSFLPFTTPFQYQGAWDASTNTPTLADGIGTIGFTYIVSTGGTQNLGSGNITFSSQEIVTYNGTRWERIGASTASWGTIVGNILNQLDLQTALSLKENLSNKAVNFVTINDTLYPTVKAVNDRLNFYELLSNKVTNFSLINNTNYPTTQAIVDYIADTLGDNPIFLNETSTIADFQANRTHYYVGRSNITYDYDLLPFPTPIPVQNFDFINLSVYNVTINSDGGNTTYLLLPNQKLKNIQVFDNGNGVWAAIADEYLDNIYDLQQTTNKGATTTNAIIVRNNPDVYRTRYSTIGQEIQRTDLGYTINYTDIGIRKLQNSTLQNFTINLPDISGNPPSASINVNFRPNVSGTVAYLSDIPSSVLGAILQNGNSFTAPISIGSNDNQPVSFRTTNVDRFRITAAGTQFQALIAGSAATPVFSSSTATGSGLFFVGTTSTSISANSTEVARFNSVVNAVNYVNITNSATGAQVVVGANGSDTNIAIQIRPKGTGALELYGGNGFVASINNNLTIRETQPTATANDNSFPLVFNARGAASQAQNARIFLDGNGTTGQALIFELFNDSATAQLQLLNQELVLAGTLFQRIRRATGAFEIVTTSGNLNISAGGTGAIFFTTVNTSTVRGSFSNTGVFSVNNLIGTGDRFTFVNSLGEFSSFSLNTNSIPGRLTGTLQNIPLVNSIISDTNDITNFENNANWNSNNDYIGPLPVSLQGQRYSGSRYLYTMVTNTTVIRQPKFLSTLCSLINPVLINNNAQTTIGGTYIGNKTIVGGTVIQGNSFKIELRGFYNNSLSTSNLTIRIAIGTVVVPVTIPLADNSTPNKLIDVDFIFTFTNVGLNGTIIGQGKIHYPADTANGLWGFSPITMVANSSFIDTDSNIDIDISTEFDNGVNNITITNFIITRFLV